MGMTDTYNQRPDIHWTDVNESLPAFGGCPVLIYLPEDNRVTEGYWIAKPGFGFAESGFHDGYCQHKLEPSHWSYMPKPPPEYGVTPD